LLHAGLYGHNHAVQRLSAAFGESQYIQRSVPVVHADDGQTWWTHIEPQATLHMVRAGSWVVCVAATWLCCAPGIRTIGIWACPLALNSLQVAGTGGADFTPNNNVANPPPYSEFVFFKYGYARMTALNATDMKWEWIHNEDGSIIDRVWLKQSANLTAPWVLPASSNTPASPLSGGAKAGIAIAVVVLVLGAAGYFLWTKKCRRAPSAGAQAAPGFYNPVVVVQQSGSYAPLPQQQQPNMHM